MQHAKIYHKDAVYISGLTKESTELLKTYTQLSVQDPFAVKIKWVDSRQRPPAKPNLIRAGYSGLTSIQLTPQFTSHELISCRLSSLRTVNPFDQMRSSQTYSNVLDKEFS